MNNIGQKLFFVALFISLLFMGMVYGMVAYKMELWPFPLFRDAYRSAKALQEKVKPRSKYDDRKLFPRTRYLESGIFKYNQDKADNGLTLFTSGHAQKAFLIAMDGEIVHEWQFSFSQVWDNPPHINMPLPEDFIYWRKAHLYPNGDLLATYEVHGDTPYGYGLIKLDKDSNLLWKYAENVHHDVNVGNDGKIYALIHNFTTEKVPEINLEPPLLEDGIAILSADGQELKQISITKAFYNTDFKELLYTLGEISVKWDPWHTNNIDVLDEQMAAKFPFLQPGQLLISIRNLDVIAAIDPDTEKVVWAIKGYWHRQHDPDFLPNGNMLIFDNQGYYGKGGYSRIIEFNPLTMEIVWQYTGDERNIVRTLGKGSQQRLTNGNTLITESYQGRIFEVTPEKEIVWEFISPFRSPNDANFLAIVSWGQRINPDSLKFEFTKPN